MNNKQNHTGPNYVTYIPKIQIPNITNHIILINIEGLPGVLGLRQISRPSLPCYYTTPLLYSYLTYLSHSLMSL